MNHTDELSSLLTRFEGRRIDFKEEVSTSLYRLLSAFANTAGGVAVIGVRDQDHVVVGLDLRNNTVKKLADSITSRLGIHPVIEIHELEGKSIVTVAVERNRVPVAFDGRYYTRIGDTTREMLPDELREYFQQSIEWDSVTGPYSFDEIDEEAVKRFLARANAAGRLTSVDSAESVAAVLSRLGLSRNGGISNGAIALFGRDPQQYFQNCILRIGRFKRADIIIGDHEIRGNLFQQFEEGERVIKQYLGVRYDIYRRRRCGSPSGGERYGIIRFRRSGRRSSMPLSTATTSTTQSRHRSGSSMTISASTIPAIFPKASPSR